MYPVHVGFTTNEKSYLAELKRLGVTEDETFPKHACCVHLQDSDGDNIIVILIRRIRGRTTEEIYALLTHEITHAKQMIQGIVKEKEFSHEAEAYLVQFLAEWVFQQYKDGK